jgi:hypothetical protein
MLKENFKMDDRGTLRWFLGMRILRSENMITIDQERYIESVVEQFNMSDCKPMATPGEVNLKLVKASGEHELVNPKLYGSLVGSLLYHWETNTP